MENLRIGAAQFENRNGDKAYNLGRVRALTELAVDRGAEVVSFHEGCIPAYTFVRKLNKAQMLDLAEFVPDGPSVEALVKIASDFGVPILAGLVEKDADDRLYNTYVCVDENGLIAKYRKLHAFINEHLSLGDEYVTFELKGWTCSILICYDNNLPENVLAVQMQGADIVFMPHVTCCLPWPVPGAGWVDEKVWDNREEDPVTAHQEFMGPKARGWLMKWLPARAYDNGIYAVFTNPVGRDDDQIRNGNSMIIDPNGDVMAECNTLGDDVVVGTCTEAKVKSAMGRAHIRARRPELYGKLAELRSEPLVIDPNWSTTADSEAVEAGA